jgi:hypothetical protein
MAYIGSTPTTQSFISGTDYFNGTGSQTSFTLSRSVGSVNDIQAVVNNVVQVPNDAYNVSGTSIVFTSAPSAGTSNVYVRYLSTTTQSITPSQNTVSYATWNSDLQGETWAFRNRIINGDMQIDQRNNGAAVILNAASNEFPVDRFIGYEDTDGGMTAQQDSSAPDGFTKSIKFTTTTADSSLGGTQRALCRQRIEGFNIADLGWGTANAQTVTLSFWVRSSLTGTFGGAFQNSDATRSYPFTYTISAANTWERKSVTVAGDTTGTWLTNNGIGIAVIWGLGVGATFSGTAGSWAASNLQSATGATSVIGTLNATWYITGVQLEKGFTATNFDVLPFGTELALCQRYYFDLRPTAGFAYYTASNENGSAGGGWVSVINFPVVMRTTPTLNAPGTYTATNNFRLNWVYSGSSTVARFDGIYRASPYAMQIYGTKTDAVWAVGYCVWLEVASTLSSTFGASAEL